MTFQSLQHVPPEQIRLCFNDSFKDYFVPFQLSEEQFKNKIAVEAVDLSKSFGAFDGDRLVGLILNGVDTVKGISTAYNGGTGVLPAYRGKAVSLAMYRHCLEQLQLAGIQKTLLEVFVQNKQAIKTYERAGLTVTRALNSFKGRPGFSINPAAFDIQDDQQPDWDWISKVQYWEPAWQYSHGTLQRAARQYKLLYALENNKPAAFTFYNPTNGRIALFGATDQSKNENHLQALFMQVADNIGSELTAVHIGSEKAETFLLSAGLERFIYSYEMERML